LEWHDAAGVRELASAWRELFRAVGPSAPFLSWEWHEAWVQTHSRVGHPWLLAEYFDDGRLAGLAAFRLRHRHGLSRLEPLAADSGMDEFDLLLHPEADNDLPSRLLDVFLHNRHWQVARWEAVRHAGALHRGLKRHAAEHGIALTEEEGDVLPLLQLPDSFEILLAQRSANFRSEVRRRRRGLSQGVATTVVQCLETAAELQAALPLLYTLHNRRRRQKGQRGIFERAPLRAFHSCLAGLLAPNGQVRLYVLRTDQQPIAALYGFAFQRRFSYFQSGMEPTWSHRSPGTVLLASVLEDCIRRGEREFDFLRGSETYKSRWTTVSRRGINLGLAHGLIGHTYHRLRCWVRHPRTPLVQEATS